VKRTNILNVVAPARNWCAWPGGRCRNLSRPVRENIPVYRISDLPYKRYIRLG